MALFCQNALSTTIGKYTPILLEWEKIKLLKGLYVMKLWWEMNGEKIIMMAKLSFSYSRTDRSLL